MESKEYETRIKALEKKVEKLDAIEEIQKLQRSYGYYLEHWMHQEIIDLFADGEDVFLSLLAGNYHGKKGVARYFSGLKEFSKNPEFLHQIMQLSGIVEIDTDGQTASGRWYGFGANSVPRGKGISQCFIDGIYGAEYVKQGGKWKIKSLVWNPILMAKPGVGWVSPERYEASKNEPVNKQPESDSPREFDPRYPSGYVYPFCFKHPVTGKPTSEKNMKFEKRLLARR